MLYTVEEITTAHCYLSYKKKASYIDKDIYLTNDFSFWLASLYKGLVCYRCCENKTDWNDCENAVTTSM